MITLRVLLGSPPDPAIAVPWAQFDAAGRLHASGVDRPDDWPASDTREAILASDAVRIVALALPPMAAPRRAAAVAFAIEDQLAGPVETQAIAVGPPDATGVTLARIAARDLLSALARSELAFSRILAEPDLAEPAPGWRWCARERDGFVRRSDGSSFAVSPVNPDGDVPPEIGIGLAQAARAGELPAAIEVEAPCEPPQCAQWEQRYGVPFRRHVPWRWERSSRFADAPDLRLALATSRATSRSPVIARSFRPALALLLFATVLHVTATAGTWVARRIELATVNRQMVEVAAQAGLRDLGAVDAATAIERAFSAARHAAGSASPGDALPLLARIAGATTPLPDGVLKSATYSGGAWTLELAPVEDAQVSRLVRQLAADDLPIVHASTPSGVRMRVGPLR